ncbi:MAG TPA: hypothetical protein VM943_13155 [Pyrinomonadaceae bacterium]|nr:hypothetical protein [Pyrinomonadaceae bacterium]
MPRQKIYIMALYATRPAHDAESEPHAHEVALRAAVTVASTHEEAWEKGLTALLKRCPREEGWVNHHVSPGVFPKEAVLRALDGISENSPNDGESSLSEEPELLM